MAQEYIQVRLLRNVMTYLGPNMPYIMPTISVSYEVNDRGDMLPITKCDMSTITSLPILSERPQIPDREEWWDDEYYTQVHHDCNTIARNNREANNALRQQLYSYVDRGILEIVDDPYRRRASKTSPAKVAPATVRKKKAS